MLTTLATTPIDDLPSFGESIIRMIVALGILLGLLLLALALARRFIRGGAPANPRGIEVEASRQLEPGKRVHVIRVDGCRLLVGSGPNGLSTLATLKSATFADVLDSSDPDHAKGAA